jgi:hypothetical protein
MTNANVDAQKTQDQKIVPNAPQKTESRNNMSVHVEKAIYPSFTLNPKVECNTIVKNAITHTR